jgi:hypothetical protein
MLTLMVRMIAATIDRRLELNRFTTMSRAKSHAQPGTPLKSQILIRTWAECDDVAPDL